MTDSRLPAEREETLPYFDPTVRRSLIRRGSTRLALHGQAGTEIWRFKLDDDGVEVRISYDHPLILDDLVLIGTNFSNGSNCLFAIHKTTGAEMWRVDFEWEESKGGIGFTVLGESSDLVFIQVRTRRPNGEHWEYERWISAISRTSGIERWRLSVGGSSPFTLKVVDGIVYIASSEGSTSEDGEFYVLDVSTGAELWRFNLGRRDRLRRGYLFDSQTFPLMSNGAIYIRIGNCLYVLDAKTGFSRWVFCTQMSSEDQAYNSNQTARYQKRERAQSDPTVDGDIVFIIGSDLLLYALDASTGTVRWSRPTGWDSDDQFPSVNRSKGPFLLHKECLFIVDAKKGLYALESATGEVRWSREERSSFSWTATDFGGVIPVSNVSEFRAVDDLGDLILCDSGTHGVYALEIKTGLTRWHFSPAESFLPSIMPTGVNRIFVRSYGSVPGGYLCEYDSSAEVIYVLNAETGAVHWSFSAWAPYEGSPDFTSDDAYYAVRWIDEETGQDAERCADLSGIVPYMVALDIVTGLERWRVQVLSGRYFSCVPSLGMVFFARDSDTIQACDSISGRSLWSFQIEAGLSGYPKYENGVIYAMGGDGFLYAFRVESR